MLYLLSLGSNIRCKTSLKRCLETLQRNFKVVKYSSIYINKPIGIRTFRKFGNMSVVIDSYLDKVYLKKYLKEIEFNMGRCIYMLNSSKKDRVIDIDIVNNLKNEQLYVLIPSLNMRTARSLSFCKNIV